jgi:hypothetical protein
MPVAQTAPATDRADRGLAIAAVAEGARQYFADRRARVTPFIDAHFSLAGSLRLHRAALGWDILRAPLNLSLAAPQLLLQLAARACRGRAPRLSRALDRSILLPTAVTRQIEWLIHTELLQLPFTQANRHADTDALSEAILAVPSVADRVQAVLRAQGRPADDPQFRHRLTRAMQEYRATRAAAAEIATGLASLSGGALTLHKVTPGAVSLGPALAASLAQQSAIGAFPLGGWLGAVWYGWFPAAASASLVATTTAGLMLTATLFAAFAGIVADPIQRALGVHRHRLNRLIDALERQFADPAATGFTVHDHYVARLLDVFDFLSATLRVAKF